MNTKRALVTFSIFIFLCAGFQNCGPVGGFSTDLNTGSGSIDAGSASSPAMSPTPTPTIVSNAKYVSTSGNDTNDGSAQSPWKTISYGVSKLSSGDTLYVTTGTYMESIYISQSGITLSAYPGNSSNSRCHGQQTFRTRIGT